MSLAMTTMASWDKEAAGTNTGKGSSVLFGVI